MTMNENMQKMTFMRKKIKGKVDLFWILIGLRKIVMEKENLLIKIKVWKVWKRIKIYK